MVPHCITKAKCSLEISWVHLALQQLHCRGNSLIHHLPSFNSQTQNVQHKLGSTFFIYKFLILSCNYEKLSLSFTLPFSSLETLFPLFSALHHLKQPPEKPYNENNSFQTNITQTGVV